MQSQTFEIGPWPSAVLMTCALVGAFFTAFGLLDTVIALIGWAVKTIKSLRLSIREAKGLKRWSLILGARLSRWASEAFMEAGLWTLARLIDLEEWFTAKVERAN